MIVRSQELQIKKKILPTPGSYDFILFSFLGFDFDLFCALHLDSVEPVLRYLSDGISWRPHHLTRRPDEVLTGLLLRTSLERVRDGDVGDGAVRGTISVEDVQLGRLAEGGAGSSRKSPQRIEKSSRLFLKLRESVGRGLRSHFDRSVVQIGVQFRIRKKNNQFFHS